MPRHYRFYTFAFCLVLLIAATAVMPSEQAARTEKVYINGDGQYGKYFFFDAKPFQIPPEMAAKMKEAQKKEPSTIESTRLVDLNTTRSEGAPYMDFVWLWKGSAKGYTETEHTHDFDEFIGFIGTAGQKNPLDLGSEIEVWLGGEKYIITKSCLIFVPKGLKHCPIRFNRIDTPVLFFTGGMTTKYSRTATEFKPDHAAERNYAKYISFDVNPKRTPPPEAKKKAAEERAKSGSTIESNLLPDLDLVPGAPYINFGWLWKGSEKNTTHPEHAHDWGEVFGYIGSVGQKDPHNLGAQVEFWVGGEKHLITKSCLVYTPPGLKHCPVRFVQIDQPILWFTIGTTQKYTFEPTAKKQ